VAKEPLPGRVKTRLTPPYPPEEAAALAAAAIADTLVAVLGVPGAQPVLVLEGSPGPWVPAGVAVIPQRPGAFDERLACAFEDSCGSSDGPCPTLLIGMDTPQVTADLLTRAVWSLQRADAVIGLAEDGGWWALGLRQPAGDLLRGIRTSTSTTGAEQRQRLLDAGLSVVDLPVLRDVDTVADVEIVAAAAPGSHFAAAVRAGPRAA
jgi:uncharacterized protein